VSETGGHAHGTISPPPIRRVDIVAVLLLGTLSYLWSRWIFDPAAASAGEPVRLFLYGLPLIVAALALALWRGRFAPIAAVPLALILAQRVMLYSNTPDLAFYAGKTLWAARGEASIDPVLGMATGYPPAFFVIWGWISRLTGVEPLILLRWATVWNLVGLWVVLWWYGGRLAGKERAATVLWVAALALFAKEIAEYLFASPACFSMPLALAGWWSWATARRWPEVIIGAILLGAAAVIWPTHLLGAVGVGLVMGWRRIKDPRAWAFAAAILLAAIAVWLLRPGHANEDSWSGLRLIPPDLANFVWTRLVAIVTLGTDANGALVALVGFLLVVLLVVMAKSGGRAVGGAALIRPLWQLSLGLAVGAVLAAYFMIQPAHAIRIAFLAAVVIVPLAARGLDDIRRRFPGILARRAVWIAGLGLVWLLPFLAAVSVSTQWDHWWIKRDQAISDRLNAVCAPGQRVWASPDAYCRIVLGKMPVYGFLAHRWPLYYSAPQPAADSMASVYYELAALGPGDSVAATLRGQGVDWVIIDRVADSAQPLAKVSATALPVVLVDSTVVLYRVP
jgi:hypothetical protein